MDRTNSLCAQKGGTLLLCFDYCKLNAVTERDSYPIPRLDECIYFLGRAAISSFLNANSGYCRIEIEKPDGAKIIFTLHHGLYWFIYMPSGLRNEPGTFQRTMEVNHSTVRW